MSSVSAIHPRDREVTIEDDHGRNKDTFLPSLALGDGALQREDVRLPMLGELQQHDPAGPLEHRLGVVTHLDFARELAFEGDLGERVPLHEQLRDGPRRLRAPGLSHRWRRGCQKDGGHRDHSR